MTPENEVYNAAGLVEMAIRTIVRLGNPVLRQPAVAVAPEELSGKRHRALIDDMIETMRAAGGVGLAAPQVGVARQILVYEFRPAEEDASDAIPLQVLVNPMVEPVPGELVYDWEGCLSIPDLRGLVPRHPSVKVNALDGRGRAVERTFSDFEARIVQHEYDHLNGVVFLDRMRDLKSLAFSAEWQEFLADSGVSAAQRSVE